MKKRVLIILLIIVGLFFLLFFVLQKGKKPSGVLQVSADSFQSRRIIKDTLIPILQAKFSSVVRVVASDGRVMVSTPDSLVLYGHSRLNLKQTYRWLGYKDAGWLDSNRITFVSEKPATYTVIAVADTSHYPLQQKSTDAIYIYAPETLYGAEYKFGNSIPQFWLINRRDSSRKKNYYPEIRNQLDSACIDCELHYAHMRGIYRKDGSVIMHPYRLNILLVMDSFGAKWRTVPLIDFPQKKILRQREVDFPGNMKAYTCSVDEGSESTSYSCFLSGNYLYMVTSVVSSYISTKKTFQYIDLYSSATFQYIKTYAIELPNSKTYIIDAGVSKNILFIALSNGELYNVELEIK